MMMIACDQVGAFVADALTDEQRSQYVPHLDHCDNCQREVREFSETTVALASLAAVAAPAELRPRVLAAAARVRPLPPLEQALDLGAHPTARRAATPDNTTSHTVGNVVSLDERRTTGRRGFLRWGVAAAAVGVVGLGASGTISGWRTAQQRTEAMAAQNDLLAAPDARVVAATLEAGGQASYLVSKQQNRAMFVADQMPELPAGKVYQQWTLAGLGATADVTFDSAAEPVWLTGDVAAADRLAITIEDAPGAQQPDTNQFVVKPVTI